MVKLQLKEINERCRRDPAEFVEESEQAYRDTIHSVAELVCSTHEERPIVLLNGPSSSGKTTTARCLRDEMERMGVHSHAISMDDYYQTRGSYPMPVDEEGKIDLESPLCMDLPLLSGHLAALAEGREISVPQYDFPQRRRTEVTQPVRLQKDEVAVIEGIHALNDVITGPLEACSIGVYMAVGTQVVVTDQFRLAPHKLRFVRRAIRDKNFRDAPISETIDLWRSVRRGEKLYIHPYVPHAARIINTYLPYEDCILMNQLREQVQPYLEEMQKAGLDDIIQALELFEPLTDYSLLPQQTIMHEFIG
ncbi:MAG: nucleoside kinase [Eubacteriales bacterium]|nr:nucleoside kinase [Eubacteriales bacterium]